MVCKLKNKIKDLDLLIFNYKYVDGELIELSEEPTISQLLITKNP